MSMQSLLYWIVFAPLVSLLINAAGFKRIPRRISGWLATVSVAISAILSWVLFLRLGSDRTIVWDLYEWIGTGSLEAAIGFQIDLLSGLMLLVVTTVSALVHLYSIEYMEDDEGFTRFFIYLNLFVFSMLVLITANNLLMMFIGWEGVGLCSYLLIGFWYDRESARKAGQKAFIVNRIGDFSFLVGMFLTLYVFGTLRFGELASAIPRAAENGGEGWLIAIGLLLFGGAVGKSAQFPLYVWLPDAMEGPTPVSSLIHAATMVTAGVYMVARLHFLYAPGGHVLWVGYLIALIGAFTAFYAATMALVHPDMKRILAYSTISQLGYMFVGVGVGAFGAGLFHLMTHAFFKGLLFLMAGSVMHALHGELNIFKMGGLSRSMPITATMAVIGGLGLSGFPLISGFWSKDEVLLAALGEGRPVNWILFVLLGLGAFLTAFYTFRMLFVAFWGQGETEAHECGWRMSVPMGLLAVGTLLGGAFLFWTHHLPTAHMGHPSHTLVTTVSLVAVFGGILLAYLLYQARVFDPDRWAERTGRLYQVLNRQYYVDAIYDRTVVRPLSVVSRFFWRVVDDILVDGFIDFGAGGVDVLGILLRFTQTGYIRHYLMFIGLALLSLISVMVGVLFQWI